MEDDIPCTPWRGDCIEICEKMKELKGEENKEKKEEYKKDIINSVYKLKEKECFYDYIDRILDGNPFYLYPDDNELLEKYAELIIPWSDPANWDNDYSKGSLLKRSDTLEEALGYAIPHFEKVSQEDESEPEPEPDDSIPSPPVPKPSSPPPPIGDSQIKYFVDHVVKETDKGIKVGLDLLDHEEKKKRLFEIWQRMKGGELLKARIKNKSKKRKFNKHKFNKHKSNKHKSKKYKSNKCKSRNNKNKTKRKTRKYKKKKK